jgi:hypothetical protein
VIVHRLQVESLAVNSLESSRAWVASEAWREVGTSHGWIARTHGLALVDVNAVLSIVTGEAGRTSCTAVEGTVVGLNALIAFVARVGLAVVPPDSAGSSIAFVVPRTTAATGSLFRVCALNATVKDI